MLKRLNYYIPVILHSHQEETRLIKHCCVYMRIAFASSRIALHTIRNTQRLQLDPSSIRETSLITNLAWCTRIDENTRPSWLFFPTHDFVPRVISRKIEKDLLSTRCNVTRSGGLRLIANLEPALLPITEARVIAPIFLSNAHSRSSTPFWNTIILLKGNFSWRAVAKIASENHKKKKNVLDINYRTKLLGVLNWATFDTFFFVTAFFERIF